MNTNLTEIVCILDRSGSMGPLTNDVIGGFNKFVGEQRTVPGEVKVTLVLFDHEYLKPYDCVDIKTIPVLDTATYVPRGMTALLDALGKTITTVGERLAQTPEEERPEKVLVVVMTDGYENSSLEYTKDQIKEMIEHQQSKYSWNFIFLGANMDAIQEGGSVGFRDTQCLNFMSNSDGVSEVYSQLSTYVTSYRQTGQGSWSSITVTDEEYAK